MKVNNRKLDNSPVIGIRPVLDGRRKDVREALEGKTMALANAAARLIEHNCRTIDGEALKCIIAESTIGGIREVAACEQQFRRQGVSATLTVTPSWCYPTETMELDPLMPKAIWGFNGTRRPGAVYLAALSSAHDQFGLPIYKIYGRDIQDLEDNSIPEDIAEKIILFAGAASAVGTMRGKSYLSMGTVSMGIASSIIDPYFLHSYLGMRTEYIDMSEFTRRIEQGIYSRDEFNRAMEWIGLYCKEMADPNPEGKRESREHKDQNWETSIKMTLIARDLMEGNDELTEMGWREEADGHYALAAGFQGQRQWTDFMPTGDFMEAMLNTSFDWNGIRRPYIFATENDSLNAVSMLFGHLLTGTAQVFADVRAYWSPQSLERIAGTGDRKAAESGTDPWKDGFLYLTNSGSAALDGTGVSGLTGKTENYNEENKAIKPFWELTEEDVGIMLEATRWGSAKLWTFRGGGFSSSFTTRAGIPLTMVRLNLVRGRGPVLQIAEGYSHRFNEHTEEKIIACTDPTWPKTFFIPRLRPGEPIGFSDTYSLMNAWGANHCSLSHGHIGTRLITLASMLRIPVILHNIPQKQHFRPSYWTHFGPSGDPAADTQSCQTLGPLYGGLI